jgi:hypothetical protein
MEFCFIRSLRPTTPYSARNRSFGANILVGTRFGLCTKAWHFEIDSCSDGEKALRYNRRGPVLGRGQVARHRVLVPGSQVRILPPQPRSVW